LDAAALLTVAILLATAVATAQEAPTLGEQPEPETPFIVFVQPPDAPAEEPPELSPLAELEQLLRQPVVVPVPIVYSASRREEKSTAAPATVIVIERQDIVERGYSQLVDVLRDLPGMETIEFFRSEWGTQVPVRGISGNNKIVVLVNGMRVNPPGGENFPFHKDFSVRHAERVEVVYGSGSTLYGEDAISAVINVVIKEPEPCCMEMEVGAESGIHVEREAWGWYAGQLCCCPDIKLSTYVQYHDSALTPLDREFPSYWQDFRNVAATKTNAGGAGVVPDRNEYGLNVFGRAEWEQWSFQIWHRQSEVNSAEGRTPVLGYLPQAIWRDSTTVMEGKNVAELHDNVSLESRLTYNIYEIDPVSRFVFPASPTEWFLGDFKYGRGWRLGLEETLRWDPTDRLTFLVGGLARYSDIIPKSTFVGGFDPSRDPVEQGGTLFYSEVPGGPLTGIPLVSQVKFWTYAVYSEGQWQLNDRLRLIGGFRVTWDGHFNQVPVIPRGVLIYEVNDQLTSKYIYTQGFVQPAPYFAFAPFDNGQLLATVNPDVAPETAETHEVNLTYHGEEFMLGVAGYYGTQSNIITVAERAALPNIIQDPVFLDGLASEPRTLVQTVNGGDSERWGVDLYGRLNRGRIRSWFSYSFVDFREMTAGVTTGLPGISKHNGRLGVTWEATPKLLITPSLVIRSTPENTFRGRLGREIQDPWELNLYALYRYAEHMHLFVDLRNITDHHYALGGLTQNAFPQETFSGVAGLRLMY
jgi:outer membrane receptor protein involved in Fe transport